MTLVRFAVAAALLLAPATGLADTTVYVVRHAEKVKTKRDDPVLTAKGKRRAATLARMLRAVPLSAVYTTKYRRNTATAAPTAKQHGLEPIVHDADDTPKLAAEISARAGQHVLVVGHSNTVPEILSALGVKETIEIGHDDYDDLFIVFVDAKGAALSHLHFAK